MSSVSLSRRRTVFGKFLVIPCCWSFHSVLLKSIIQFLFIISLYISSVAFITGLFNMFGNILLSLLFSVVLSSIKYIHSHSHSHSLGANDTTKRRRGKVVPEPFQHTTDNQRANSKLYVDAIQHHYPRAKKFISGKSWLQNVVRGLETPDPWVYKTNRRKTRDA